MGLDARVGAMTGRIVAEASEGVGAALGQAIRRSTAATDAQAETLTAASDEVKTLLATLGRVVGEMSAVFAPLRSATVSIERSVLATQDMPRCRRPPHRAERSDPQGHHRKPRGYQPRRRPRVGQLS